MFMKKLGLIVWKNLLLRQQQCVVSVLEMAIPILGVICLVLFVDFYLRPKRIDDTDESDYTTKPEKSYGIMTEDELMRVPQSWCERGNSSMTSEDKSFLAFTPDNPETEQVVQQAAKEICARSTGSFIGFIPVANERELESIYNEKWGFNEKFRGAVVFTNGLDSVTSGNAKISYKIRMEPDKFPSTSKLMPTQRGEKEGKGKYDTYDTSAPDDLTRIGPNEENEKRYVESGFIGVQLALDKALAKTITNGKDFSHTVSLQAFPYPAFTSYYYAKGGKSFLLTCTYIAFSFGMCFMIPSITRNVVGEKETGVSELLRLTGVTSFIQWIGWLIHAVVPQLITITFITLIILMAVNGLEYANPVLIWVMLLLYVLASAAFCFFLCAIFQKPTIATTVTILLWLIFFLIGVMFLMFLAEELSFDARIGLSVFPNFALAILFFNWEQGEYMVADESDLPHGTRWSTLAVTVAGTRIYRDKRYVYAVANLYIMLMLLLDLVVYMALAVYLECVLPSEHGVKRPWYLFKCGRRRQARVAPAVAVAPTPNPTSSNLQTNPSAEAGSRGKITDGKSEALLSTSFEPEPEGGAVGVDIQNLQKRFGQKAAVNGVSLRMFTGDIFALLGHNGAGKTTLISMLTGFAEPSGGTAVINGYDIRQDIDKARGSLGLCPQHNMLFDRLSVAEQLYLFGRLRGLTLAMAKAETDMLLANMKFLDKRDTLAMNLSGGQKRKLSLGIALIGGTKVVVLDEPSSGMDPQARREIWDLLLMLRGQRTILLTTHFMEEADVLGDRIGIMASGQLQCCGTTAFLKKYYGTGYTLKLTLQGGGKSHEASVNPTPSHSQHAYAAAAQMASPAAGAILAAVQKHIPDASHKTDARLDLASNEVFITLPAETATTAALSQMFAVLTANKDKLGIKTIGLSQTSMDEVFVRVGELAEHDQFGSPVPTELDGEGLQKAPKVSKRPFVVQFLSLLLKRFVWSYRKWALFLFEVLVPLVLFMMMVHWVNSQVSVKPKMNPRGDPVRSGVSQARYSSSSATLAISLDSYDSPVTFYFENITFGSQLKASIGSSSTSTSNVSKSLIGVGEEDRIGYKRHHIVAAEMTQTEFKAMFNLFPYHAAPLAINLATNAILKYLDPDANHRIQVTNHPFNEEILGSSNERSSGRRQRDAEEDEAVETCNIVRASGLNDAVPMLCSTIISLALILFTANFVVNPIEENLSKAKQLQTMTGASPLVYWGANFVWDYSIYFLVSFLMLIYLLIFDNAFGYAIISNGCGWLVLFFILMVYGFSVTIFTYLMSLRSSSVAGGFSLVTMIHLFLGWSIAQITISLDMYSEDVFVGGRYFFGSIGRLFPTYALVRGIYLVVENSANNSVCPLRACNVSDCPTPEPYITWWKTRMHKSSVYYNGNYGRPPRETYSYSNTSGVAQDVFFMILLGLIYGGWLMLIELKICRKMVAADSVVFPPNIQDEDVYLEAERVNTLISNGQMGTECLLVQNLCKNFGDFIAVSQLHFGVHHGECFGLLGVNGAGKTTAFRMITGDETPSRGKAFGFGTTLESDPSRFFSNIGYCPQFDAILDCFTGKEMLQLFAGLRGVPYKMRGSEAMKWLTRMGLQESANVKCGRYSGGMKRRLSTAMAMIGDPALILLDEPTSGVDPVSRRQFWKILDKLRASGQSIILTSHSMEECEALCSRLGIMVNGQFQCFGGVQHLKNKFAQGYSLTLKLKPDLAFGTPEVDAELQKFEAAIIQRFQPCELKDKHQNLMQYHLKNPAVTWEALFKAMEEVKSQYSNLIETYSVNETSLEEVFLALARMQHPERQSDVSLCKRICTCRC